MSPVHIYKLSAYPKEVALRDGTKVTLKPMTKDEADGLLAFFSKVPAEERHYLKEDVTSPKIIHRWAEELDYDRALPLLAWVKGKVIADGVLMRSRAGARRHVGEIRIVVDPAYRAKGLGTILMHELAAIANDNGLERLHFQAVMEREDAAIKASEFVGFVKDGDLPGHAKHNDGHPRDILNQKKPQGLT
ncbi:MAG: GNAT family N-acetyltransferase, partial [Chloroflexi bacterium]|nr:GNAT family N-acetyltransferase [Chloroflexota bacterium]